MGLVAITAGCFTLAAYLNRGSSYAAGCVGYMAAYACLVAMKFTVRRSTPAATVLLQDPPLHAEPLATQRPSRPDGKGQA